MTVGVSTCVAVVVAVIVVVLVKGLSREAAVLTYERQGSKALERSNTGTALHLEIPSCIAKRENRAARLKDFDKHWLPETNEAEHEGRVRCFSPESVDSKVTLV